MGLITTIQNKTEQVRAKERIRPLLESRMMRDILLEIGQRGNEQFRAAGGEELVLVPCLNTHESWVRALAAICQRAPQPA